MHSIPAPRPSAAGSLTEFLTAVAAVVGSRQPRKVPPLHTAQAVHEVVADEYRISGLSELRVGDLLADWVCLFETPSSGALSTGTGSLCCRAFLPGFLQAWPCGLSVTVSGTTSGALLGSFRAWSGSASCWQGSLRVKPRWLGPPPSTRVLLLFLHFLSRGHSFLFSSQSEPGDLVGSQKNNNASGFT